MHSPPSEAAPYESGLSSPPKSKALGVGLMGAGAIALAGLGVVAVNWWTSGRFIQATNDAYLQADQVVVAPKVAGYVEQVLVGDNQPVSAGQPLVRIDPRDHQAKLDQAKAEADIGQASVAQARAQVSQQEAAVAESQARLQAARATARYANRQLDRYLPLAQSGVATAEQLDRYRQDKDQAVAQAAAAAAQVMSAQRELAALEAQIALGEAKVEEAEARMRQAGVEAEGAVVRASISGRVGDRSVRVGQYVEPGTRLMAVVPVQSIYLVANFKETQIGRMRPGQPVEVEVDALGGLKLKGVVDSFAPGTGAQFAVIPPSNATGNFTKIVQRVPVRIRLEAPEATRQRLVPGLSVKAAVDTKVPVAQPQQVAALGRMGS